MELKKILGIDASNINDGGGLVNLINFLECYIDNPKYFKKIFIFCNNENIYKIPDDINIIKIKTLNKKTLLSYFMWNFFILPKLLKNNKCDVLFVPGSSYLGSFKPFLTVSQNMLPFAFNIVIKMGSRNIVKFFLLRIVQTLTFLRANHVIFLNEDSSNIIRRKIFKLKDYSIISHGAHPKFFKIPKKQISFKNYNKKNPFKILYVSNFDPYKNHLELLNCFKIINQKHLSIKLYLVGNFNTQYNFKIRKKLKNLIANLELQNNNFLEIFENVSNNQINKFYFDADLFIYPSNCENMPIILLEAMASGLPIICSDNIIFKNIIGETGVYFNCNNVNDIYTKTFSFINNPEKRSDNAVSNYKKAQQYLWTNFYNKTIKTLYSLC